MISKTKAALAALFLLGLSGGGAIAKELSYGIMVAPTSPIVTVGIQPFADAVRKATDGSVDFKLHTGGSLVGPKTSLSGLRDGLVDAALVAPSYVPSEVPKNSLFVDLTFLGVDPYVMMAAATETMLFDCKGCNEEYGRLGVVPFGMFASTPYYLMCKKPAANLAELAGRKVLASNPSFAVWMKEIGLVAINLPGTEIYDALDRGQVDCVFSVLSWLDAYSLNTVVTAIFDLPMGLAFASQPLMMNRRTWDRLPAPAKAAIAAEVPALLVNVTRSYVEAGEKARKNAEAKGVEWVKTPDEFVAAYERYSSSDVARAVDAAVKRGMPEAPATADVLKRNIEKWTRVLAPLQGDPEKVRQAIAEGIFTRVDR